MESEHAFMLQVHLTAADAMRLRRIVETSKLVQDVPGARAARSTRGAPVPRSPERAAPHRRSEGAADVVDRSRGGGEDPRRAMARDAWLDVSPRRSVDRPRAARPLPDLRRAHLARGVPAAEPHDASRRGQALHRVRELATRNAASSHGRPAAFRWSGQSRS